MLQAECESQQKESAAHPGVRGALKQESSVTRSSLMTGCQSAAQGLYERIYRAV